LSAKIKVSVREALENLHREFDWGRRKGKKHQALALWAEPTCDQIGFDNAAPRPAQKSAARARGGNGVKTKNQRSE
jgi:hypothetical protein